MGYNLGDWEKPPLEELMHYGVKGMKWGHHKRVESVEVTRAKKAVKETTKELYRANTKRIFTYKPSKIPQVQKRLDIATIESKYANEDLKSAKILDRLKKKPKSEKQLSLEARYKKKGMSDDEAAVAAYKNIRTKKVLAVVAGVAVISLTAYGAYKFHDNRVDKIIKSGTLLQNISNESDKGIRDAFYSSMNKIDRAKYKGMYGLHLSTKGEVFKKEIKVLSDIKQASPKNAQSILAEAIRTDPEFAKGFKDYLRAGNEQGVFGNWYLANARRAANAELSLSKNIIDKNVYEVFNASLVDHAPEMQTLTDKYYSKLAEKGYNAIRDVNDSKFSGYKALNPVIAFNANGKLDVVSVRKLAEEEMKNSAALGVAHVSATNLPKNGAIVVSAILAKKKIPQIKNQKILEKEVNKYRQEHPETTLTNTEIIRMLERRKVNE